jgi:hypothetical protein
MPSYESSMRNLAKARAKMRPPRPWCSIDESRMIRRFAFQWCTACGKAVWSRLGATTRHQPHVASETGSTISG